MTPRQKEILARLNLEGRLPSPKGVAMELIQLTRHEDYSVSDIVRLISTDPALSARVIKAANALFFNAVRPVLTISDAVTVLGARAMRQLVLGLSLMLDYKQGPCKQFDYANFWSCSLLTGIAVRHLALRAKLASAEEIFVVGLLAEIGELAMTTVYPEEFGALLDVARKDEIALFFLKERELAGFEHAEFSAAILAEIGIPPIFQAMVRDFSQPELSRSSEGSREWKLMIMLHVASLVARVSLALPSQRAHLVRQLREKSAEVGIDELAIIAVAEECSKDWPLWTALFNMPSRVLPSFAELFEQAASEPQNINIPKAAFESNDYKMRVLVVEDDRSMRDLLQKMLTMAGHHVSVASNGAEALTVFEKELPQLVVTDWIMPVMDGISLCRELRSRPENWALYVIIVTAQESPEKLVEAFEAGADDYLIKPITHNIFNARLRAAQRVVQLQEQLDFDRQQLVRFSTDLAIANERLQHLVLTDPLTELPNRRLAMERLTQEWALTERGNRTLTCMMVDIDHFKPINDKYGHQVGDDALKLVATTLRQAARTQDVVCRYGGEEFLVICPDSSKEEAYQCAERMRKSVAGLAINFPGSSPLKMTVSIGLAEKGNKIASVDSMLMHADVNLYLAKEGGRNRTIADR